MSLIEHVVIFQVVWRDVVTLIIGDLKLKCRELSTLAFPANVWRDVSVHVHMYTKIADRMLSFSLVIVYQKQRNFPAV